MNYQHSYHAGNFADVFKHIVLSLVLQAMSAKSTPYTYLDTHAGAGKYDLPSSGEHTQGIERLWAQRQAWPELADYWSVIADINAADSPRCYPGSPALAHALARPQDSITLIEAHPDVARLLKAQWGKDARVHVHQRDGYEALKALLPPDAKRGVVLIDPPFEDPQEFRHLLRALRAALQRWPTGVYCAWFPLKDKHQAQRFERSLRADFAAKILWTELRVGEITATGKLMACGMVIINPPWRLDVTLEPLLQRLATHLAQGPGAASRVAWVNETLN